MLTLPNTLRAWDTAVLPATLKAEIEAMSPADLPLHLGVSQAGMVGDEPITATVLSSRDQGGAIEARVGVFFTEIVINCGCGDEPMPINSYCELLLRIDKVTAETTITVVTD